MCAVKGYLFESMCKGVTCSSAPIALRGSGTARGRTRPRRYGHHHRQTDVHPSKDESDTEQIVQAEVFLSRTHRANISIGLGFGSTLPRSSSSVLQTGSSRTALSETETAFQFLTAPPDAMSSSTMQAILLQCSEALSSLMA